MTVDAGGVRVREGRAGYEVDRSALRTRLESLPSRVRAPTIRVVPQVTTAEARATAQRIERLTGDRRTILVGSVATVLEPGTLRTLMRVHPSGGGLSISFDAAGLARLLPASVPPRDATFRFSGSKVGLVPAVQGRILDVAGTALRLAESDTARVEAAVTFVEPDVTTAELAGARDPRPRLRVHDLLPAGTAARRQHPSGGRRDRRDDPSAGWDVLDERGARRANDRQGLRCRARRSRAARSSTPSAAASARSRRCSTTAPSSPGSS